MAKWRGGDAARSFDDHPAFPRALRRPCVRRARQADTLCIASDDSNDGFTLIELVIVIGVMPLVIGALAVGLLSVFSLQSSVSNRLTDSGDAQVVSVNFQNDVQSASIITTASRVHPRRRCRCGTGSRSWVCSSVTGL